MFEERISTMLVSLERRTQHEEIMARFTFVDSTFNRLLFSASISPSVPLLLTNENVDEAIEHEADDSLVGSIRIIGLLMN